MQKPCHREQVERSADYLGTTLDRKANASFFLEASINDLLRKHNLESSKRQEGPFQKTLKGRQDNSRSLEVLLATSEIRPKEEKAKSLYKFKRLVLSNLTKTKSIDFFNQHLGATCEALDVVFLCVQQGKINLDKERDGTETQVSYFFERARFAIEGGMALFSEGLLKKSNQRKVTFVLAIVDDRGVEQYINTEIKKENKKDNKKIEKGKARKAVLDRLRDDENSFVTHVKRDKASSLFNSQDLWGLDRTRMAVQKQGFSFLLVVTNEYKDETWDAFGSIGDTFGEEETGENKEKENPLGISFPKGTHKTTIDNCNNIISHMRGHPNEKYTAKGIEAALDMKNVTNRLNTLVGLEVLQREKNGRSYQYFLKDDKVPVKSENLLTLEAGSSPSPASSTVSRTHPPIKKQPISLKDAFKVTPLLESTLKSYISQKITFSGSPNSTQGLFSNYLTCPTIGDGDCFFHAILTEPGESPERISVRTLNLREQFCNRIETDEPYARSFAPLLYEYYRGLWGNDGSENIPRSISILFQKDDEYVAARNTLIGLDVDPLPPQISLPQRYSVKYITNQIPLELIASF